LALLGGRGGDGALLSTGGLRAATLSFKVGRGAGEFWEFESFIRILMHRWDWG
jgi:hypothetical protein